MRLQPHTSFDIDQRVRTSNSWAGGISPQHTLLILLILLSKKRAAKLVDLDQGIRMANAHSLHDRDWGTNAKWIKR
ncbi:MAG TPA: hypothetical protein VNR65_06680, partial [Geobacterales bacterium]|nr:hypothetical protein [Geobacterales bacterium]